MSKYEIRFTKEAVKDIKKSTPKMRIKLKEILKNYVAVNPYGGKKLVADLTGFYSLRLNHKDRIIYSINEVEKIIFAHKTHSHYGE